MSRALAEAAGADPTSLATVAESNDVKSKRRRWSECYWKHAWASLNSLIRGNTTYN